VAACDLDPVIVREGKEQLFEESYYGAVFPKSDPDYYLSRYWLGRHVAREAKGFPERAYAKWLVLHFMWQRLASVLTTKTLKQAFRTESERGLFRSLSKASAASYRSASAYYRANRGAGAAQIDPSSFFKRIGHHDQLEAFWRGAANSKHRNGFKKAWTAFTSELEDLANA
jgi:hypothetical protein